MDDRTCVRTRKFLGSTPSKQNNQIFYNDLKMLDQMIQDSSHANKEEPSLKVLFSFALCQGVKINQKWWPIREHYFEILIDLLHADMARKKNLNLTLLQYDY